MGFGGGGGPYDHCNSLSHLSHLGLRVLGIWNSGLHSDLRLSFIFYFLSRVANSINVLMIFDQIGGSFELAKQIAEVFLHFFFGYVPKSAFYCILMVSLLS